MNKSSLILISLILLSFLTRAGYSFSSPIKGWDEAVYSSLGWDLKSDPLDYGFKTWADKNPVMWDRAGFRPPLLPYILAGYHIIAPNNYFLINFLMPVIGAVGVFLVFLLSRTLFNEKVGLYSAAFMAFIPLHVVNSSRILTDTLVTTLLTLAVILFWYGFEKDRRGFKPLSGFVLGLAFLARYTALFMPLVFIVYALLKHRNINFVKDPWTWYAVLAFFVTISPWLVYSYLEYDNPIGALLHASTASSYWRGDIPWYFFFSDPFGMFSILTAVFLIGFISFIPKLVKWKQNMGYILIVAWLLIFLIFAVIMPHKEERHLVPLVPPLAMVSALFVSGIKRFRWQLSGLIILVLLSTVVFQFGHDVSLYHNKDIGCFLESVDYLRNTEENAIIFTESSPTAYYYTHRENHFVSHGNMENIIRDHYEGRPAYLLLSKFDGTLDSKDQLSTPFEIISECPLNENPSSLIFKYNP